MDSSFVWRCKCGHVEYQDNLPEDCSKCLRVANFKKIPEDMVEEVAAEEVLSINPEDEENDDEED